MPERNIVEGIAKRIGADDLESLNEKGQQMLLIVLGPGPSLAALQSLVAAERANAAMYGHAVENQQLANLLSIAATVPAVRYKLDFNALPEN